MKREGSQRASARNSDPQWGVETDVAGQIGRGVCVFGVLGVLVAPQLGLMLRVGCFEHDDALVYFSLPVLVPFAMAFLGAIVAACARPTRVLLTILAVVGTSLAAGTVAALVWWPDGVALGVADGFVFGLVALPFVFVLLFALRGEARRGSLLDVSNRCTAWATAGAVAAASSVVVLPFWRDYPSCTTESTQAVGATLVSVGLAVFMAAVAFAYALRALATLASPPRFVDVGIGESEHETQTHPPTAYRNVVETVSVVRGDITRARRAVYTHVIACAVAAVAAVVFGCASIVIVTMRSY